MNFNKNLISWRKIHFTRRARKGINERGTWQRCLRGKPTMRRVLLDGF